MRLAAFCFALVISVSGVTFAQDAAPAPAPAPAGASVAAREAFRRGEAAYSAGNYDLAIREWQSAYNADPRPRIQFNLSQAYERLGELEKAMDALRKFLDSGDPDDPMYSDANARLSALQQRMALTGVMVRGGGDGGQILVDDKDWGRTPRPDKINVAPGTHTIVVKWPGRNDFRTTVVVPAGQVAEVQLPEDSGAAPAATPTATQTTVSTDNLPAAHGNRRWLWYGIGIGASAVGVGALAYGIARGSAAGDCGGGTYCEESSKNSAETQSLVGYISGGVLLAAGATAIVLGVLSGKDSEQQAKTQCGIGLASASCRFRF